MKIFIPFNLKDIGGTSSFVKKFKRGLEKKGHHVFLRPVSNYDILFVISRCPIKYLIDAKLKKKKIIHRLDGVYYWSVAGWKYFFYNLKPLIIYKFFSDLTIYQSLYSKYCVNKFFGKNGEKKFQVIYNGVDLDLFSFVGEKNPGLKENPDQKIFFTASRFRRKDQIIPLIKAIQVYDKKYNSNYKFIIAGTFSGEVSSIPNNFSNQKLVFVGKIKNEDLPKFERTADVFLFSHLNPPCPNNVIEAMACGLPICGVADGSMKELVAENENGLLTDIKGDAFWAQRSIDSEKFAINLDTIVKNKEEFSQNSRKIAEKRFSLEAMINNYLKVIK